MQLTGVFQKRLNLFLVGWLLVSFGFLFLPSTVWPAVPGFFISLANFHLDKDAIIATCHLDLPKSNVYPICLFQPVLTIIVPLPRTSFQGYECAVVGL